MLIHESSLKQRTFDQLYYVTAMLGMLEHEEVEEIARAFEHPSNEHSMLEQEAFKAIATAVRACKVL